MNLHHAEVISPSKCASVIGYQDTIPREVEWLAQSRGHADRGGALLWCG
jgi:ribosomal protein L24E